MVMVRNSLPVSDIKIYSTDTHPWPPCYTLHICHPHPDCSLYPTNAPSPAPAAFAPSIFLFLRPCSLLPNNSCPPPGLVYATGRRGCGNGCVCMSGRFVRMLRPSSPPVSLSESITTPVAKPPKPPLPPQQWLVSGFPVNPLWWSWSVFWGEGLGRRVRW